MMQTSPEQYNETIEAPENEPALFEAILQPHRSLSPKGFIILMTAITAVSFVAGGAFVLLGAWPVFGFFGLDVLLIYFAFRINYHSARIYESIRLTESALTVVRMEPDGQISTWKFQPYWLRVGMDDPPRSDSELTLTSHGRSLAIGDFLTPDERLDLAETLRYELQKLREIPDHSAA